MIGQNKQEIPNFI